MHYLENDKSLCGTRHGGGHHMDASTDASKVLCPICVELHSRVLGCTVKDEKSRLARIARRESERAAHLALKARVAKGISWQEARAMAKLHTWRDLEDWPGD